MNNNPSRDAAEKKMMERDMQDRRIRMMIRDELRANGYPCPHNVKTTQYVIADTQDETNIIKGHWITVCINCNRVIQAGDSRPVDHHLPPPVSGGEGEPALPTTKSEVPAWT